MSDPIYRRGPQTERLRLRAFEMSDAAAFYALNSNPEVMRHTGEPPCPSLAAAAEALAAYPDFERYGYGRWATVLESEDRIIGFCGLKWLDDLREVDLGYRFLPEYWGRGLATEAGAACLRFGFSTLGLSRIIALALPENPASVRVLHKLGFEADGEITYDGHPGVLRYVATAPTLRSPWVAATARSG